MMVWFCPNWSGRNIPQGIYSHDEVRQPGLYLWWRHQIETFSASLALCAGNSPVPANSPHKGQWRGALMFSLICVWINGWVNNRETGDLRLHRGHYDVIVMNLVKVSLWGWGQSYCCCNANGRRFICVYGIIYFPSTKLMMQTSTTQPKGHMT